MIILLRVFFNVEETGCTVVQKITFFSVIFQISLITAFYRIIFDIQEK
jgi:hypothetical protein